MEVKVTSLRWWQHRSMGPGHVIAFRRAASLGENTEFHSKVSYVRGEVKWCSERTGSLGLALG